MRFNPITIAWVLFAIVAVRMAIRMLDGGAEPVHFAMMGAGGLAIAGLILLAGRYFALRQGRRPRP